jgi:putative mRNA 3-end processing factor
MRLIFHGAAKEVGRSCIELAFDNDGKERRFILDAGFKMHAPSPTLPTTVTDIDSIDGVFITHAHLDHIGALPYFHHYGLQAPIFMTGMTQSLSRIMLKDSFHLELLRHHHPAYDQMDVSAILKSSKSIPYYHLMRFHGVEFEYIPSGHIPGSAMILFVVGGKTILYTGDVYHDDRHLQHGLQTDFLKRHNVDIMITESTYGNREHKSRSSEEQKFVAAVKKTLNKGGSVIVPAFAIGRAQELAMILADEVNVPVYLDGMAKKVADLLVRKELHIRNADKLKHALDAVHYVNPKERNQLLRKQCVIITTSGMVSGGPVMEYLKHVWHNPKDAILLTGFQGEGTNGRMLLEEQAAVVDGMRLEFKCSIQQFDFSGHAGKKHIVSLIKKVKPKTLIINHGNPEAENALKEAVEPFVQDIHLPETGSSIIL